MRFKVAIFFSLEAMSLRSSRCSPPERVEGVRPAGSPDTTFPSAPAFAGTLLLVTHDRYLMERVTDHQFALIDGKVRHLPRGVEEYLELTREAEREAAEAASAKATAKAGALGKGVADRTIMDDEKG